MILSILGGLFISGTTYCLIKFKKTEEEKIIHKAKKIINNVIEKILSEGKSEKRKTSMPKVVKLTKKDYGYDGLFSVPLGISTKSFKDKQDKIEQFLNCKIDVTFSNGYIKMKILTKKLAEFIEFEIKKTNKEYLLYIGESAEDSVYWDVREFPSMLVAGTTGSGKSTWLKMLVTLIILTKKQRYVLYLFDFKRVTLNIFKNCKYVKEFCNDIMQVDPILQKHIEDINNRYEMFEKVGLDNLEDYAEKYERLPRVVSVFDEFKDIRSQRTKALLDEAARKGRACGYHYVFATQRPTVDVVDGSIKANCDVQIAFKTANPVDSVTVLGQKGSEELRGNGHGLVSFGGNITEFQSPFIDNKNGEITELIKHTLVDKTEKPKKEKVDETALRRFLNEINAKR